LLNPVEFAVILIVPGAAIARVGFEVYPLPAELIVN
jgi:hypothetical protein